MEDIIILCGGNYDVGAYGLECVLTDRRKSTRIDSIANGALLFNHTIGRLDLPM